jgi:hypothetical protein
MDDPQRKRLNVTRSLLLHHGTTIATIVDMAKKFAPTRLHTRASSLILQTTVAAVE